MRWICEYIINSIFHFIVLRQVNGLYMLYGQDHGKEGILQIGGNINDTQLYDQQIWRILLSHSSFLELNPSSLYEEEILTVIKLSLLH